MKNTRTRGLAVASAAVLTLMTAAPAMAAETVAQADASAVTASLAGNASTGSGSVQVTNDGTGEQKTGTANPAVGVLQGQSLASFGVLAQDATTRIDGGDGLSAACAGVAGDGGAVVEIGDTGCLQPGQNVGATLGNLDLNSLDLGDVTSVLDNLDTTNLPTDTPGAGDGGGDPVGDGLDPVGDVLDPVDDVVDDVVEPLDAVLDQITAPLQQVVDQAEAQLGDLGLTLSFGAVEAICAAEPGAAEGEAILTDAALVLQGGPAGDVTLLQLPVSPAPNTQLVTDLGGVATAVLDGLETNLEQALQGQASQLTALTDAVQTQIVDGVLAQVAPQLAPLEENVARVTLNAQSTPSAGAIEVTALDAELLPGAAALGGPANLASIQIGSVGCGPNGVVEPEAPAEPAPLPEIPTAVSAGEGGTVSTFDDRSSMLLFGALTALAGAAGVGGLLRRGRSGA